MQNPTFPELSAIQLQMIDDICNAFELAFKSGKTPRAEDFLNGVSEPLQNVLLPELLQLEKHYDSGFSIAELSRRFPQLEQTSLQGLTVTSADRELPEIPGYLIIEEIGRGGMGVVYRAADLELQRQVALKMIHRSAQFSNEHRRRFVGEARAAARLHHPNLVQIFNAGEIQGHPFLVFELVKGGTLADRIRDKPLTYKEAATLVETLSLALQYAHERHIVHRDLKPSNVLLGADGVAKISDFGLAKRLDDDVQQTASGHVVGTPSYMAPEQADGRSAGASPAVDVYALGAILYELLTGVPPFKAPSVMETLEQLRTTDPVPPRTIRPGIPRDLETICLKCLQKEPARRYISAQLLAEELGRFLRGESIMARPVGSTERVVRWCRRHPLPASLTASLIGVVVAAFVTVSWQWQEAVVQRTRAERNAEKFQTERNKAEEATARARDNAAEAQQQRTLAEKNLAAAESRFEKAQAPIQELIRLGVELTRQPQMETRGRQALEKATQFREALLEEKTDDPEARYITASTLRTLAWTLLEHGEFADADQTYYKAREILKELHADDPNDQRYLSLLSTTCLERGVDLSHLDQLGAAEQSCRESVGYAEKLADADPGNPGHQINLGNALTNWAGKLSGLGRQEEAVSALQRSVQIHREVISRHPDNRSYQGSLALVLRGLAAHLWSTDRAAAESAALEALEIHRSLVARTHNPRNEAMYLIASLNQLTEWYTSLGRFDEAERLLSEATEQALLTKAAFPAFYGTRYRYISTLVSARRLALKTGDDDRVEALVNELRSEIATALVDFPTDTRLKELDAWFRHVWAFQLADRGKSAEAIETLTSALDDLCKLQARSSVPEQLRGNIISIARAFRRVGKPFEFEAQKLHALRVWAEQDPDNPSAHNSLAWRQLCVQDESLRDPAAAEQSVRRAIELKDDEPFFYNTLGTALYYQDRLDEAAREFERSLNLKTSQPSADWSFLAMIESRRGHLDKARDLLKKAQAWQREHDADDDDLIWILDQATKLPGLRTATVE